MSPYARKIAGENGIDLHTIKGSGPNGRIVIADVEKAINSGTGQSVSSPAQGYVAAATSTSGLPSQGYEDVEVSQIRRVIASRLSESKATVPHFQVTYECEMDRVLALRAKLNQVSDVKISVNDMVMKAAALACKKVPETISSWQGSFIR
jgi:pyruvate dehydrogenase E2 component (dihydrolipoamide acetyltransferase)